MLVDFKGIGDPIGSLISNEAFFKDEGCILFHILDPSIFLSLLIYYNVQLLDWLLIMAVKFNMHFNNFSCLLRDNIIQLSCEIFRWETEVLGKHDMPENVLTI
jgi:hypothetical protein